MPSYNEIDGIPSHANRWMLRYVLRAEWGFEGTIVSDWQAISQLASRHRVAADTADAARQALDATVDVELPDVETYGTLIEHVKQGKVSEAAINDAVRRLLREKFELGLFENPFVDPARAEQFAGASRTGLRYTRHNPRMRATLARAVGFFLFASAYWALLPLIARNQLHGGPTLYGVLLGAIGAGAVAGALLLPRLNARSGPDGVVLRGQFGTAAALLLFGLARTPWAALLACLMAGASWIGVLASLNVSAQVALPEWVRGRGLAVYVTVFFGTMTVGSA